MYNQYFPTKFCQTRKKCQATYSAIEKKDSKRTSGLRKLRYDTLFMNSFQLEWEFCDLMQEKYVPFGFENFIKNLTSIDCNFKSYGILILTISPEFVLYRATSLLE